MNLLFADTRRLDQYYQELRCAGPRNLTQSARVVRSKHEVRTPRRDIPMLRVRKLTFMRRIAAEATFRTLWATGKEVAGS